MVNQAIILATLGLAGNSIAAPAVHRAEGHARRVLTEDSSIARPPVTGGPPLGGVPVPQPIGDASTLPAIQNDKRFWTQAATALASGVAGVLGTNAVSGDEEKREVNVEEKRFWTQAATALASGVAGVLGTNAVSGDEEKRALDVPEHEKRFWAQVGQALLGGVGGGIAGQMSGGDEEKRGEKREEMQSIWIPDEADIWVPEDQQSPEAKRFWTQAATALASGVAGVLGTNAVSGDEEKRQEATQSIWIPDDADIWVPEDQQTPEVKRFWTQAATALASGVAGVLGTNAVSGDEEKRSLAEHDKRFWAQVGQALLGGVGGGIAGQMSGGDEEKRSEALQDIWIPDEADIWVPEDQQTPEVKRFWTQAATALASGVAGVLGTNAVSGDEEKRSLAEHDKRFWAQVGQALLGGIGGGIAGQATSGDEEKRSEGVQDIWIPDEADIWIPEEQQTPQQKRFWAQVGQALLGGVGGGIAGQMSGDEKRAEGVQDIWIPDEADIWIPDGAEDTVTVNQS